MVTPCLRLALLHIRFENARCRRRFFLKYGEKISVFENTRLCVDCQIRLKNATCGQKYFLNTEEKISVFESTRLRVDEARVLS